MSDDEPGRDVVIFTEALQLPVVERAAFLERACAGDENLRTKVESLLLAHEQAGDFLEKPLLEAEPQIGQDASIDHEPLDPTNNGGDSP
jgi:hypothetical protein